MKIVWTERMTDWSFPFRLEQEVARIMCQQEVNGWLFNHDLAIKHLEFLKNEMGEIFDDVKPLLRKEIIATWKPIRPYLKNGDYNVRSHKWYGDDVDVIGATFTPIRFDEPSLGSRQKIIKQLTYHGWKPLEFTDKGNPKLTEESMEFLGDVGKGIARWYIYNHRRGQIEGFLKNLRPDGRITAGANTLGTPTGRMTHRVIVNVPKNDPKVIFGNEMRQLFTVPEGKVQIGYDAAGLEARMMGHYLDDKDLIYEIIHGDFHTKVWDTIRDFIESRAHAKNIEYALIYGASDSKLGTMADFRPSGWSNARTGRAIREGVMSGLPSLAELTEKVQRAARSGYLIGLDGRKLWIRSNHSALNFLFQAGGAIVMKLSMVLLDKWIKEEGLTLNEVMKVGDFHDEGQQEVVNNPEVIELIKTLNVKCIREAGEYFKLRCPLDAEAVVGMNWAETH